MYGFSDTLSANTCPQVHADMMPPDSSGIQTVVSLWHIDVILFCGLLNHVSDIGNVVHPWKSCVTLRMVQLEDDYLFQKS